MDNVTRIDKWTPRAATAPSGKKKERLHAAWKRSRQEEERSLTILPWEQKHRLPSYLWNPWECDWTCHAIQRAFERDITDQEFRTTFMHAAWASCGKGACLSAVYGRCELVISFDGPRPLVITVIDTQAA